MKIGDQSSPPSEPLSDVASRQTASSEPEESSPYAGLSLSQSIYTSLRETFSGFVNWVGVMPLAQAAPQPILEQDALSASDLADFMEVISELSPPEVQKKLCEVIPFSDVAVVSDHGGLWMLDAQKGKLPLELDNPKSLQAISRSVDRSQVKTAGLLPESLDDLAQRSVSDNMLTWGQVSDDPSLWAAFPMVSKNSRQVLLLNSGLKDSKVNARIKEAGVLVRTAKIALQGAKEREMMARQAMFDPLTGLANKDYFTDKICAVMKRSVEQNSEVSIAYFDADDFSQFNTEGHELGDRVLQEITQIPLDQLRNPNPLDSDAGDLAIRAHGSRGDEFVLVLENCSKPDAAKKLERVRKQIEQQAGEKFARPVTVTVGVASASDLPTEISDYEQMGEEMMKLSDRVLMRGKQQMKNQVYVEFGQAWERVAQSLGLASQQHALLYEAAIATLLSAPDENGLPQKVTPALMTELLADDNAQRILNRLALPVQSGDDAETLSIPEEAELDDLITKLQAQRQGLYDHNHGESGERMDRPESRAFGLTALRLGGFKQNALNDLFAADVSMREQLADRLVRQADAIHGKPTQSSDRHALLEQFEQDVTFNQALATICDESDETFSWQTVKAAARWMNLGEVNAITAVLASSRVLPKADKAVLFRDNFTTSAKIMSELELGDEPTRSLVAEIRYAKSKKIASQLLDLLDQMAALSCDRPARGALPPETVVRVLQENAADYGIDPSLLDLVVSTYQRQQGI